MIEIKFQFNTLDEAIVALARMVPGKVGRAAGSAEATQKTTGAAPVNTADTPPLAGATTDPLAAPATPDAAPTRKRKPRSDAGQVRGPYKQAEGAGAETTGSSGAEAATDPGKAAEQAANPTSTSANAPAPEAPVAPVGDLTEADVAKANERLYNFLVTKHNSNAAGINGLKELLSRYGVTAGRFLLPDQRAPYIAEADAIVKAA